MVSKISGVKQTNLHNEPVFCCTTTKPLRCLILRGRTIDVTKWRPAAYPDKWVGFPGQRAAESGQRTVGQSSGQYSKLRSAVIKCLWADFRLSADLIQADRKH